MVSGGLAIAAETKEDKYTQLYSHYPVQLTIGGKLGEDLGGQNEETKCFPRNHEERSKQEEHS
eukprot:231040-Heterocapsa_arctica.AAC.1